MKQKTLLLLLYLAFAGSLFAEMDIPQAIRVRVDGKLSDWRRAEWYPLKTVIAGSTSGITHASWTATWDEDALLTVAVQYDDANIVLKDGTNIADCVQFYVRGDTGSSPSEYADAQQSAQSYALGLSKDGTTWLKQSTFEEIAAHNPVKAAVSLEGTRFACEIMVQLYDGYDPTLRHKCSDSEIIVGNEIGLDIAILDVGTNGAVGIIGDNSRDKRNNANAIAEHILDD